MDRVEIEKRVKDSYELPNAVLDSVRVPLVSVSTITFSHAAYIRRCIDGVLMQRTSFPFEYIIGEDCSTDGTREIVMEYAKRHPDVIRVITSDRNAGAKANACRTRAACRGKYIAVCEGDDYWTDPYKLQKQVDFLEGHPECVLCFHDVLVVYEDGSRPSHRFRPPTQKQLFTLEDVLTSTLTQTCSLVVRRDCLARPPDWFYRAPIGDWALNILAAEHGKLGYLDEVMAVYRKHSGGVWAGIPARKQLEQKIQMYELFNAHFEYRYASIIEPMIAVCRYGLAVDCWLNGLSEEQAQWMRLAVAGIPETAQAWLEGVLTAAHQVEALRGSEAAGDVINWTCASLQGRPRAPEWCRKLRAEWYAAHTFSAHQVGDAPAVRHAASRAVRYNWHILKNLGFLSIWSWAVLGTQRWQALRRVARRISRAFGVGVASR